MKSEAYGPADYYAMFCDVYASVHECHPYGGPFDTWAVVCQEADGPEITQALAAIAEANPDLSFRVFAVDGETDGRVFWRPLKEVPED